MALVDIVLLDADGVIQTVAESFRRQLDEISGAPEKSDELLEELWIAEYPCLTGNDNFLSRLDDVLSHWGKESLKEEVLSLWTSINSNSDVLNLVTRIRAKSIPVVLASSQESFRACYMAEDLGYNAYFDSLFFSCEVGYMKPDLRYFKKILAEYSINPERSLFIDDNAQIVKAAEEYGLIARQFDLNIEPVENLHQIFLAYELL